MGHATVLTRCHAEMPQLGHADMLAAPEGVPELVAAL